MTGKAKQFTVIRKTYEGLWYTLCFYLNFSFILPHRGRLGKKERKRFLSLSAVNRMVTQGPDNAFILQHIWNPRKLTTEAKKHNHAVKCHTMTAFEPLCLESVLIAQQRDKE